MNDNLSPRQFSWYHGSPHALEEGTVLEPQAERNFKQSKGTHVSITSESDTALHWAREAAKTRGEGHAAHVYEVEPQGDITPHRVRDADYGSRKAYEEALVPRAVIKRRVFGGGVDHLDPPRGPYQRTAAGYLERTQPLTAYRGNRGNS